ncbi:MAG: acetoacetate decarboxylase family protein [Anaerolineae bacterium]|nr:acetoacetate decarboxylase family protein [Anaerolineae bacterium]
MPYQFDPDQMYRMPTHFGPRTGPRRGPDGRKFECRDNPYSTSFSVSFLSNSAQLEKFLPPGFALDGEPVVTVSATYMTEIEWLAGRGYNTLGVSFPARFEGEADRLSGSFLTVLWENLTDPILTGREEIGFSKIYCELPTPTSLRGQHHIIASWLGFKFLDLYVDDLREQSRQEIDQLASSQSGAGILHYKYVPRTGEWGRADAAYAVLTPAETPNRRVLERKVGAGSLKFHKARWEDMPTQYNIVNAFADLEIREYRGASLTKTVGGKDLSDQRILR